MVLKDEYSGSSKLRSMTWHSELVAIGNTF